MKTLSALEALQDAAERWDGLVQRIEQDRPWWHPSPLVARGALLRYLAGASYITGIPVVPLLRYMREERDPLLAKLVCATTEADWHHVLTTLLELEFKRP